MVIDLPIENCDYPAVVAEEGLIGNEACILRRKPPIREAGHVLFRNPGPGAIGATPRQNFQHPAQFRLLNPGGSLLKINDRADATQWRFSLEKDFHPAPELEPQRVSGWLPKRVASIIPEKVGSSAFASERGGCKSSKDMEQSAV